MATYIKANSKGMKIHKACINYKSPLTANMKVFKKLFELSAKQDYMRMVRRYKKDKR